MSPEFATVDFCGELHQIDVGQSLTFGRAADLLSRVREALNNANATETQRRRMIAQLGLGRCAEHADWNLMHG